MGRAKTSIWSISNIGPTRGEGTRASVLLVAVRPRPGLSATPMTPGPSWRTFRRMQDSVLAIAGLIWIGALAHAWRVLPGGGDVRLQHTLIASAAFFAATLSAVLFVRPVRAALSRSLWTSYRLGFGQSVISVLSGMGVVMAAGVFIVWQTQAAIHGGRYPAGAFCAYAAGVGLFLAQAILVRRLERDPDHRSSIEAP